MTRIAMGSPVIAHRPIAAYFPATIRAHVSTNVIYALLGLMTLALASCSGGSRPYGASPTNTASTTRAAADVTLKIASVGNLGQVLTDAGGFTLYTYKPDASTPGKSACNGSCATSWPPLAATGGAPAKPAGLTGDLALITRSDGGMQVTYQGQPLYRYSGDKAPGDANGQGVGGVWSAATVAPASSAPPAASPNY